MRLYPLPGCHFLPFVDFHQNETSNRIQKNSACADFNITKDYTMTNNKQTFSDYIKNCSTLERARTSFRGVVEAFYAPAREGMRIFEAEVGVATSV
jgi:hypothetical protein